MRTLVKGGHVLDPSQDLDDVRDILIEDGVILDTVAREERPDWEAGGMVVEAEGLLVVPGLIDMHVHLREPGHEYKETVATGAASAAAGGFTAVACMPNTSPVCDESSVVEYILARAEEAGMSRVWPIAAMTHGSKGEKLSEYGDLAESGAVGVSDDGCWVTNAKMMRRALEYARVFGLTPISHPEEHGLSAGGVMNEGPTATSMGLAGIPAAAEEIAVFRDIRLSELTGAPVHLAHISTAGSVDIIRAAKERGIKVTAETAPHYFMLDDSAVRGYSTLAKMNPPLRTAFDIEAIRRGLADGTLDAIATDHAPHSSMEKDMEFDAAAFGIIGLETALPLSLELVADGVLTLKQAIEALSCKPASILGVQGGTLRSGAAADLTIIDRNMQWVCDPSAFKSKSRNTPFGGRELTGRPVLTMVGGRVVHRLSS